MYNDMFQAVFTIYLLSCRITDITMTECSAYGEIGYGGGRREDTPIYEFPCTFVHSD